MVARYKTNQDIINTNVREDLIALLDEKIVGFRDIKWRSRSKRFTDKDAKTVKYELVILITDCYWNHELKHKADRNYYSLFYEKLKGKLGKDYKKYMDTVFDVKHGVTISSWNKKDGLTQKYRLKDEVIAICDDVFRKDIKQHSLMDRSGNVMRQWTDYAVSKSNEGGDFQKKINNKKYKFSPKVLLNRNNATLLTHMWSDLYKYRTGRLQLNDVEMWIDIIDKLGSDINDEHRFHTERLKEMHDSSLEIYNQMMTDIVGVGYVGQQYVEKDSGRLYAQGYGSLQSMMREQRNILMSGLGYWEYDMENAHYSIVEQYYNLLTNNRLTAIRKYVKDTKGHRYKLANDTGVEYKYVKQALISLIYGSGISTQHTYINGRNTQSAIFEICGKQTKSKTEQITLWENFTTHKIVLDLFTEIDLAYQTISQSWIESGSGKGRRMKNMSNKTTAVNVMTDKGDMRRKSKGQLLSHFLQGIEARILWGIMNEERDSFVMPHHDGWVSRWDWNLDKIQQIISLDTRKMLLDYNGIKGAFDIKIKKVELTNVIDGDWTEKILSKGVVHTIH